MKEQIWPCLCQFSWDSFSSTLLFPSFTWLFFFFTKAFSAEVKEKWFCMKLSFFFFTLSCFAHVVFTLSHCSWDHSAGLCEEPIDARWCFFSHQWEMEAQPDESCWSSGPLVKNHFPILCRKWLYWRWVSALSSKNGVWIGLGCNRGLSAVISSATAPGQSILWETSWTFQVSLRIRIDPHAVLFILFHFVCHRLLRYVLILPSLDSPLF